MDALATIGHSLAQAWWMFYDTFWALAVGFTLSGAVQAFVSRKAMQRSLGDHRPGTVAKASFYGMVSSSCSYAASAMAKTLFARGADLTASMAFMFASTNLVLELGLVLWLLVGWQFAVAEFAGGAIMIALLTLAVPRIVPPALADRARDRLDARAPDADAEGEERPGPRSRAGWSNAAGYALSDVTMLRKELLIGFVVAGFAAVAVPIDFWRSLFLTGHGWLSTVENVLIGPVLAFISFVCSVGNVPLAAALWNGGISFGGVVAFVFADLLTLPLVLIYRKYYGNRLALRLVLTFWAVVSIAGLVTEGIFRLVSLVPAHQPGTTVAHVHVGWNYTTILDVLALGLACWLAWLYRNRERLGGGGGLAKDVVCGMQVRTADAPAKAEHAGSTYYFCSDRCHDRFVAEPERFTDQASSPDRDATPDPAAVDPVCGMSVDPSTAAGHATYEGNSYYFCSPGCRERFRADPASYAHSELGRRA